VPGSEGPGDHIITSSGADRTQADAASEPWRSWGRSGGPTPATLRFDIEALIARQPRAVMWLEAILFIALVAFVDDATSSALSFSIFYIVPVIFATWFLSRRTGLLMVLLTVAAWHLRAVLDVRDTTALFVLGWNMTVRVGFFLIVWELVHLMKVGKVREGMLARTDSLTGVANGRAFSDRADFELAALRRSRHPLTMAYMDLDRFKHVNDTLGHTEGDRLLRAAADAISSRLRATDFVARLGGDEFGILLPDTDSESAPAVLAALSQAVKEAIDGSWGAGCTMGAITFEMAPESVDFMVRSADELMYRGKREGRGRTEHAVWPGRRGARSDSEAPPTC